MIINKNLVVSVANWQVWCLEFGSNRSHNLLFGGIEQYIACHFELN